MADEEKMSNGSTQCHTHFRGFEASVPRGWSQNDRFSFITVSKENLRAHVRNQSECLKDGAAIRATYPVPPSCGLFYFEIRVVAKGREGGIVIGLSTQFASLAQLPGTELNSYGYHSSDGRKYHGTEPGHGKAYGPTFTTGDVVGCGLNYMDNSCFFTKNGLNLGVAFTDLPRGWELYPTVGFQSVGGAVDANFGQHPFIFDVENMRKAIGAVMRNHIDQVPLPDMSANKDSILDMEKIVTKYLLHNGYCNTAAAFASATGQNVQNDIEVVTKRQQVLGLVLEGQITHAMELIDLYYPGLLPDDTNLHLLLRVRQFIEVVSGADTKFQPSRKSVITSESMETDCASDPPSSSEGNTVTNGHQQSNLSQWDMIRGCSLERILECGKKLHALQVQLERNHLIRPRHKNMVCDAFSLISYADPHSSPVGWQLDPSQREVVADQLKEAILARTNVNNKTDLECYINYAKTLLRLMEAYGIGKAAFVNFDDIVN
ncbi:unnamed protein product [Nesidiocoris tenuis]|uniref:CTLH n=2 Tax=Nesidiocoris tenuis TaxID=355587 RepID=A0ABN7AQ99_9HEMI|nr:CTLH [Nesidiocoris tenuis]CAA9994731.1 unnamed protein product [Nesidiocoris tenuis]